MSKKPFTRFMDMHSGGGAKTDYEKIYIEGSEDEARVIFMKRFGINPDNVTCDCCGEDFSISESPTLAEASGYDRGCKWKDGTYVDEPDGERSWQKYQTVEAYVAQDSVLVIYAEPVKAETKPLYILISDGGDGSYSTNYTFSTELIDKLQEAYDNGLMDYENGVGCDGDGFHYDTLQVPVDCTYESLGISYPLSDDYADQFNEDAEE